MNKSGEKVYSNEFINLENPNLVDLLACITGVHDKDLSEYDKAKLEVIMVVDSINKMIITMLRGNQ